MTPNQNRDPVESSLDELAEQLKGGNIQSASAYVSFQIQQWQPRLFAPVPGLKGGPDGEQIRRDTLQRGGMDVDGAHSVLEAFREIKLLLTEDGGLQQAQQIADEALEAYRASKARNQGEHL